MTSRGTIDRTIGVGNGKFLGDVANHIPRAEIERNFKAGRYPDLHTGLAHFTMTQAGLAKMKDGR